MMLTLRCIVSGTGRKSVVNKLACNQAASLDALSVAMVALMATICRGKHERLSPSSLYHCSQAR